MLQQLQAATGMLHPAATDSYRTAAHSCSQLQPATGPLPASYRTAPASYRTALASYRTATGSYRTATGSYR
eukprot:3123989-Prymnesium_polylepis.1